MSDPYIFLGLARHSLPSQPQLVKATAGRPGINEAWVIDFN
jgi:hypothetical protein